MSTKCDKVIAPGAPGSNASQGCACVTRDPVTGGLLVDGVPVAGGGGGAVSGSVNPSTGISAGQLNSTVLVNPSQLSPAGPLANGITIAASAVTGLCAATIACLTPGSVPVSALGAGSLPSSTKVDSASIIPGPTAGTVLTSTGTGTVWAAPASTPVGGPISPSSAGIASGALNDQVTIKPSQLVTGALPSGVTIDAAGVTGVLPASAVPCEAVLACVNAAPAGSITANKIGGGAAGQILTSNGTNGVWSAAPTGGGPAPTAETLGGTQLNSAIKVSPSQISPPGPLPSGTTISAADVTGLCAATLACVNAAPNGSIAPGKITPGTAGQVLVTDASGVTAWAAAPSSGGGVSLPISPGASGLSAGALNPAVLVSPSQIQSGPLGSGTTISASSVTGLCAATIACLTPGSVPASAIGNGALGSGVTIKTAQISDPVLLNKAAADASPASTAAAPLTKINGVNSAGSATASILPLAQVGPQSNGAGPSTMAANSSIVLASVTAPRTGLYVVSVAINVIKSVAVSALATVPNQTAYFLDIPTVGRSFLLVDTDYYHMIRPGAVGDAMGRFDFKGVAAIVPLAAGAVVPLAVYGSIISNSYTHGNEGCFVSLQEVGNRHIDF